MIRAGLMAMGGVAVSVSAQTTPPQQQTVQQAFEAATALEAASAPPAQRLTAWEAIERRVAGNPRSLALVRVRKASALLALDRGDEALAAVRAGLAALPERDASLAEDRAMAWLAVGDISASALDYAGAVQAYAKADVAGLPPPILGAAWLGLYRTQPYVDADAAAATVARVTPQIAALRFGKTDLAAFARYDAERLLNRGDYRAAKARALEAVKLLGGLTTNTNIADVPARHDVSLAALLLGDTAMAREYLAMTGAGRAPKGEFRQAAEMVAPDCGGEAGLKPADVAVVEVTMGDDGRVVRAVPVYAAGGPAVGLEFARAARTWQWTPEQAKAIPIFYRVRMRVEMRCSTAFPRPSIDSYLDDALGRWLASRDVPMPDMPDGADVIALPVERAALAKAEAAHGPVGLALVPPLQMIVRNRASTREEANAAARRALSILATAGAPPMARLAMASAEWSSRDVNGRWDDGYRRSIRTAIAEPVYAADPEARSMLRIMLANAARRDTGDALAALRQVADDTALSSDSPVRAVALARLASFEYAAGNAEGARAAFAKSGLDAKSCALIDSPPRLLYAGASFPEEAQAWGFSGFTQTQYDIAADGRTTNVRTVLAYPPFVFSKASEKGMAGARFAASYRPEGGLGCGGTSRRFVFLMP